MSTHNEPGAAPGFLDGLQPVVHIAHRGGAKLYPENTLFAFRAALRSHQTQVIETDVHLSSDGEVVIFHDETVERTTNGRGRVSSLPWSSLSRLDAGHNFTQDDGRTFPFRGLNIGIPRLTDVLEALPAMRFNIELKGTDPRLAEAVKELIRIHDAAHRVCLGREDDAAAEYLFELLPDVTHFFPREALTRWVTGVLMGAPVKPDSRYRVLELPAEFQGMHLITPAVIEQAKRHGLTIYVWTIDDADQMKRLMELGVSGIMTDRPDILRKAISLG